MPQPVTAEYRPWRAAGYEGWVDRVLFDRLDASCRADPGRLLELPGARVARGGRNLTLRAPVAERTVWLKFFRPKSLVDRIMYAPGAGKAVYAWNAAMALTEQGFRTPRPLIGLRRTGRLGGAEGIAAFEDVGDHDALDEWLGRSQPGSAERDELARALGRCLKRFHDIGFRHRDLRRGNILAAQSDGQWSFCFLDVNRLRIQAPLTPIQRMREVERLNLSPDLLYAFFSAYMPDRDSATMVARYRDRLAYADDLERRAFGRLRRKAWYYSWEARAFGRARRP